MSPFPRDSAEVGNGDIPYFSSLKMQGYRSRRVRHERAFWMRNKECPHFGGARGQLGFASANARRRPSATKSAPMLRFIQVTIALL